MTPLEVFIHRLSTAGALLMGCAIVALIIGNSPPSPAFEETHELLLKAKMGILFASLIAGVSGFLLLRWVGRAPEHG